MKSGSEYKVNVAQKYVKKPFKHFNILTRFRVSVAFNSFSKIAVLFVTTTLTMTALMFATSNIGKFTEAKQNTFNSRNYSYAVDLYTPTLESGQYIPTSADYYGDSGMLPSVEGTNFIPGNYFLNQGSGTKTLDTGFASVFGNDQENNNITKNYYSEPLFSSQMFPNADPIIYGNNPRAHQNLILPMEGDGGGQVTDLQYLKNRFLDKSSMDMVVGFGSLSTNP
jgi:putative ABC transport system permease protein